MPHSVMPCQMSSVPLDHKAFKGKLHWIVPQCHFTWHLFLALFYGSQSNLRRYPVFVFSFTNAWVALLRYTAGGSIFGLLGCPILLKLKGTPWWKWLKALFFKLSRWQNGEMAVLSAVTCLQTPGQERAPAWLNLNYLLWVEMLGVCVNKCVCTL